MKFKGAHGQFKEKTYPCKRCGKKHVGRVADEICQHESLQRKIDLIKYGRNPNAFKQGKCKACLEIYDRAPVFTFNGGTPGRIPEPAGYEWTRDESTAGMADHASRHYAKHIGTVRVIKWRGAHGTETVLEVWRGICGKSIRRAGDEDGGSVFEGW